MMRTLIEVLGDLVALKDDLNLLDKEIRGYSWDSTELVLKLTKEDFLRIIDLFEKDKLTTPVIETWANLVECRDDLFIENNEIQEIIFERRLLKFMVQ